MMDQSGRRPWIRQKQVEERERVVEKQRIILGDSWATDVFFEGCWFGVVGVGLAGKNRATALGGTNPGNGPQIAPRRTQLRLVSGCD